MVGITKKQNHAVEVKNILYIYYVLVCNVGVVEVERVVIDLDTLIEVVVMNKEHNLTSLHFQMESTLSLNSLIMDFWNSHLFSDYCYAINDI